MRVKLLFVFIFLQSFLAHNQIKIEKIETIRHDNNFKLIKIDNLGNKYYLSDYNLLKRKELLFSDSSMGLISKVDLYNALKIKVWFQDFNSLIILDNFLNEITRINFNEIPSLGEIYDISSANDNSIWVFDETDMKIKKFDFFKRLIIDNIETKIEGKFLDFTSNYNYLWVITDLYFYKINYNGSIIYKSKNSNNFNRVRIFKNDVILANNNQLIHFKNDEELFVNIKHEKLFIKDFSVIDETLYIYDKDHLNKYLILTY